jgi:hypothetical protein
MWVVAVTSKTKYMINRQDGNKVKEIELMGKRYEKVQSLNIWEQ